MGDPRADAKLDTDQVAAEVAAGRHDVAKIAEALNVVTESREAGVRWRVDCDILWPDLGLGVVEQGDITLGEWAAIERITDGWWGVDDPTSNYRFARALLAALLLGRGGVAEDEVQDRALSVTTGQLGAACSRVEVRPADPT